MSRYDVKPGVTSTSIVLSNGDEMFISKSGATNNITVDLGGTVTVLPGGKASVTDLSPWSSVSSGADHAVMMVSQGGQALTTTIKANGFLYLMGGSAVGVTLSSGGSLHVSSGAFASNVRIISGASATIFSGGTASGFNLNGDIYVSGGGGGGGRVTVNVGALLDGAEIHSGGTVTAYSGAILEHTSIYSGGSVKYGSGVSFNLTTVYSGAVFNVLRDNECSNTTVSAFGRLMVQGGASAKDITVSSSGELRVAGSGAVAASPFIESGGSANVMNGGQISSALLAGYQARLYCSSGGTAIMPTVASHAVIEVLGGGVAKDAWVDLNGFMYVSSGGLVDGATVHGLYAIVNCLAGGCVSAATVDRSGTVIVSSSGLASDCVVNSSGTLNISYGGSAVGLTVNDGGKLTVSSGGDVRSAVINSGGDVTFFGSGEYVSVAGAADVIVSSGGTLTYATAETVGAQLSIRESGYAAHTMLNKYGSMAVSYGGVAVDTAVNGGFLIVRGGQAHGVLVTGMESGFLHVSSGGTATGVVLNGKAQMVVSGGSVSGVEIKSGGLVLSGGEVTNVQFSSGAAVEYDGRLNSTVVYSGCSLNISGGSAFVATIRSKGYANVLNSASADSMTISSGGTLFVDSDASCTRISAAEGAVLGLRLGSNNAFGGTSGGKAFSAEHGLVSGASVCSGMSLSIDAGATASDCRLFSRGSATIRSNGVMSGGAVNYYGTAEVDGGQARSVSVLSGGSMSVKNNGTVTKIGVDGTLAVSSGGSADQVSVHLGGWITVLKGGSAHAIELAAGAGFTVGLGSGIHFDGTSGGSAFVIDGPVLSGFSFRKGTVSVSSGASMINGTAAGTSAQIFVSTGGFASGITVSSGGYMAVSSGATLNGARVFSGGSFYAGGGSAVNVVLDSGAYQSVYLTSQLVLSGTYAGSAFALSGGVLSAYHVQNGDLSLAAGISANQVTVHSGGTLSLYSSANVTNATVSSGGKLVLSYFMTSTGERKLSGLNVRSGGVFYLNEATSATSGYTSATGISADSGAQIKISGFNSKTCISGAYAGSAFAIKDGLASGYTVHSGGLLAVTAEGTAKDIRIESGGSFSLMNGTVSGLTCSEGAYVQLYMFSSTTISGAYAGSAFAFQNGTISSYQVHSGQLRFYNGCSANRIDVLNGGLLYFQGGSIGNTTVSSGGSLVLSNSAMQNHLTVLNGGRVSGKLTLTSASDVTVSSGGIVFMDISEMSYSDPSSRSIPCINDLSLIKGAPDLGLRFAPNYTGTYTLAKGASGFNGTLTVQAYDYTDLCTLTVGQSVSTGGFDFSLTRDGDALIFTYNEAAITVSGAKSDVDGNGISDVLFQYTGGAGQIGFWMNGTSTWQSTNATHPVDTWEVLGAYDMNANGKADSVLVGNVEVGGIKGAFVGYYVDANDTDANWVNISYLTNFEGYVWKNKVGNLTGNAGKNSIVWHSTELGALGVWTDGTDNWVSLGAGYDANWTLVGCGDFDGNGKDEAVMSYLNGAKYYTVGIDGAAKDLATSDSGWTVRAIGDFSGDGKDDIVAFHKETGLVAMWGDGDSAKWSQLGQLDPKDWFVAGAGDYNGDGRDDLLVRQNSTGMLGYYSSGDMAQWNVLGYGVDMSWTVIA